MNHLPDMLTGAPWVRWPPAARSSPMKVSPGFISARNTRLVGLAAGIRLHVGEAAAEQPHGPLDGERLGDVDELAAAVIAPARIALGVFVGHHRALRLEHGARDDVLGGDQLDLVALPAELLARWRARSRDRDRRGSAEKKLFDIWLWRAWLDIGKGLRPHGRLDGSVIGGFSSGASPRATHGVACRKMWGVYTPPRPRLASGQDGSVRHAGW